MDDPIDAGLGIVSIAQESVETAVVEFQLSPNGEHRFVFFMEGELYWCHSIEEANEFIDEEIARLYEYHLSLQKIVIESGFQKALEDQAKIDSEREIIKNQDYEYFCMKGEKLNKLFFEELKLRQNHEGMLQEKQKNDKSVKDFLDIWEKKPDSSIQYSLYTGPIKKHFKNFFSDLNYTLQNCGIYKTDIDIYEVNANDKLIYQFTEENIKQSKHLSKIHHLSCALQVEQPERIGHTGYLLGKIAAAPLSHVAVETHSDYAYQLIDDIRSRINLLEHKEKNYKKQKDISLIKSKEKSLKDLVNRLDLMLTEKHIYPDTHDVNNVKEIAAFISSWKNNPQNNVIGEHVNPFLRYLKEHTIFKFKTQTEIFIDKIIENENKLILHK
jgi:hypothetical protein